MYVSSSANLSARLWIFESISNFNVQTSKHYFIADSITHNMDGLMIDMFLPYLPAQDVKMSFASYPSDTARTILGREARSTKKIKHKKQQQQ